MVYIPLFLYKAQELQVLSDVGMVTAWRDNTLDHNNRHVQVLAWLFSTFLLSFIHSLVHYNIFFHSSVGLVGGFLQSSTQQHKNAASPLERAACHIKETCPPCWFQLCHGKMLNFNSAILATQLLNIHELESTWLGFQDCVSVASLHRGSADSDSTGIYGHKQILSSGEGLFTAIKVWHCAISLWQFFWIESWNLI